MTDHNSSEGITSCMIVCALLAFAAGIFVAAALIGWAGLHGLLAAVIGIIVTLMAYWLLKTMFCEEAGQTQSAAASSTSAMEASASVSKTSRAANAVKKPAPKAKSAAKKTAAKATTSTAKTKSAPAAKSAPKPAAKKPAAAKFYRKPPAKIDDLKLISGVGPKLEKTLNEIGIYQYDQISSWKKADIAKVDDKLKFKGRIERDDWIKQAKALAKGGDTTSSKKKRKE